VNAKQFMLTVQQAFIDSFKVEAHFGNIDVDQHTASLTCLVYVPERSYSFVLNVPTEPGYLNSVLRCHPTVKDAASSMVSTAIAKMNTRREPQPVIHCSPDNPYVKRPPMTVEEWPEL
jgi:hypothetical protein